MQGKKKFFYMLLLLVTGICFFAGNTQVKNSFTDSETAQINIPSTVKGDGLLPFSLIVSDGRNIVTHALSFGKKPNLSGNIFNAGLYFSISSLLKLISVDDGKIFFPIYLVYRN